MGTNTDAEKCSVCNRILTAMPIIIKGEKYCPKCALEKINLDKSKDN